MLRLRSFLCLLPLLAACDGEAPGEGCPTKGGTVTATIDGLAFTATCVAAARTRDGFGIIADDRSETTSLFLPRRQLSFDVPDEVRTYPLGGSSSALAYFALVPPQGTGSPAQFAADTGAVVVQSINGRRYQGTFTFRTGSGTSGEHSIGNGRFDVTLEGN
jgi:hypothetical protein